MYVSYKLNDKPLFTLTAVKYAIPCVRCEQLTTLKLLISKGFLAKELYNGVQLEQREKDNNCNEWSGHFICSEACLKALTFKHCLKGNVKIRKRIEEWLNSPPQEFYKYVEATKIIVRIITNQQGDMNYVEFFQKGKSYSGNRNIQFMAPTSYITSLTFGINNLFNTKEQ